MGSRVAAAYLDHAQILGQDDPAVYATFHEAMDYLAKDQPKLDELVALGIEDR